MPRTWWYIRVDLVSGRGEDLWPRPGRVLIARPGMTFRNLADAINLAFGRWELSHLHAFTLADGTRITMHGPWDRDGMDDTATKLTRLIPGEQLAFTFDFGDGWEHLCTVGPAKVDPHEVYGAVPTRPAVIDGWGVLPDQHGRAFEGDDGETPPPPAPDPPTSDLPPLLHGWGPWDPPDRVADDRTVLQAILAPRMRDWDLTALRELRIAIAAGDVAGAERLLVRHDVVEVAHQAAPALLGLARRRGGMGRSLIGEVLQALDDRGWPGDAPLAAVLSAALGEGPDPEEVPAPVGLDQVTIHLGRNPFDEGTWYVDLRDGTWVCDAEGLTGIAPPDDLDDDTRYLVLRADTGRDEGWHDMAEFVERVEDGGLAEQLDHAIRGRGAFRRFGDALRPHEWEWTRWQVFREERQLGRARAWLAERGYRPANA